MKKIKFLLLIAAIAGLSYSCEDDGGTSVVELDEGAVPNMAKSTTTEAFFDLVKIQNGENVNISFSADIAQGNPTSVDIVAIYTTSLTGDVYSATLFSNVTLPQDFDLSIEDIVNAFPELNSVDDVLLADVIDITARLTMPNGSVLNILNDDGKLNTGTNINTTVLFNTIISYPVSCPSDIGGNYNVVSSGFSTDGAPVNNPLVNFSYDIVLTDNGGGSYTISDGVAGVYQDWYCAPYGYCFETEGSFTDVCGTITGSWTEAFGCQVDLTGTVNPDGTLTIQWANCFGDTIEEAIYTPI